MSDVIQTSPSAIETYEGCPRKWVYQSLMRVQTEPTRGQLVGRAVDEQIEAVLAGWQSCPSFEDRAIGEMAQKLLDMLPPHVLSAPRGEALGQRIEQPWVRLEAHGVYTVIGRPDLVYREPDGSVLIVDFKTTSNLRYAQTDKSLSSAIQAQFYGAAMMASDRIPRARLLWLTIERGTSLRSATAAATIDIDAAGAFVRRARDVTDRMRATKLAVLRECSAPQEAPRDTQDRAAWAVEPNLAHCSSYGGCPFQTRCFGPNNLLTEEKVQMPDAFSIFDQIQKNMQSAKVSEFPPPAEEAPQTAVVAPAEPPTIAAALAPTAVVADGGNAPKRRGRPPKSDAPATASIAEIPPAEPSTTESPAAETAQPPTLDMQAFGLVLSFAGVSVVDGQIQAKFDVKIVPT